jgi:hypothetical protein
MVKGQGALTFPNHEPTREHNRYMQTNKQTINKTTEQTSTQQQH